MRILLISTAFSGLTQRFYTELDDAGYNVSVELHTGNIEQLIEGVELFKPDLILCPFLTRKLPAEIYENYTCLIVHPGIKGDRGASSLDWAIQGNETAWGVSLLEAVEEMDAGAIWVNKTFKMRDCTKSSLFYREVTQAAVDGLWDVLTYFHAPNFLPQALDYSNPEFKGRLQANMKQADRAIDWKKHKTDEILRRIHAADGSPGVLDDINGKQYYLFNAHKEAKLKGKAGEIIATANYAICRATIDGAVWIGHLQEKTETGKGIKLPATFVLDVKPTKHLWSSAIKHIEIDYKKVGQQLPVQEVWYELDGKVAYLYFPFHNGGMSTEQCRLLLSVYQHLLTLDVNVIVLMGGDDNWSNGIHLNHIEVAKNPADESWANINAIDDLIYQIITTLDKLTISAVAGNAGAGGAILALASDFVFAREGVIFNPHYKNMGELYGSEYWTYLLPKRVGQEIATRLTEQRLPISAKKAWRLGMLDKMLDKQHAIFHAQVKHLALSYAHNPDELKKQLEHKAKTRCFDETNKPLAAYRQFELINMYANFYGNNAYHKARQAFVYKVAGTSTPDNIAKHRYTETTAKLNLGSMYHFVWQERYALNDEQMDAQHKDLFDLANQLMDADNKTVLIKTLYQHVKEHFIEEEALMQALNFRGYNAHAREHGRMLKQLSNIEHAIQNNVWQKTDIEHFVEQWAEHILNFDMGFETYSRREKAA